MRKTLFSFLISNFCFIISPVFLEPTTGIEPVNLFLTKEVLYQLSYVGNPYNFKSEISNLKLPSGAGDGNRTHASSLEGWSSTIELHPHF